MRDGGRRGPVEGRTAWVDAKPSVASTHAMPFGRFDGVRQWAVAGFGTVRWKLNHVSPLAVYIRLIW